jgi:hypothetical protein
MDLNFRNFINDTGDNLYIMSDVVSGTVLVINMITKDSFAVVVTTKTANPSTIDNQTLPYH